MLHAPSRHGRQTKCHPHHPGHGNQRRGRGPVVLADRLQGPVQDGCDYQPETHAGQQQLQGELRVVHTDLPA